MAQHTTDQYQPTDGKKQGSSWASGGVFFAGVLMIMAGVFQGIAGLVGLFENEFYVATTNYVFELDATTWGWVHLLVGAGLAFAGFAVISGKTWARVIGIVLAGLSALSNFTFIPYYPLWSVLIIALDMFIIWALSVYQPRE